jgi:hypothetical protein
MGKPAFHQTLRLMTLYIYKFASYFFSRTGTARTPVSYFQLFERLARFSEKVTKQIELISVKLRDVCFPRILFLQNSAVFLFSHAVSRKAKTSHFRRLLSKNEKNSVRIFAKIYLHPIPTTVLKRISEKLQESLWYLGLKTLFLTAHSHDFSRKFLTTEIAIT